MGERARLIEAENPAALLVPQSAVSRSPRGDATALVVDIDNKVELRTLKTERTIGPNWLVNEGLNSGDRVIVEGLQRVRPGMPVIPVTLSVKPSKA